MRTTLLALAITVGCTACTTTTPPSSSARDWGSSVRQIEQQIRRSDDYDMRCVVATQYLTLVNFPGLEPSVRLDHAQRALVHADAAIRLDDERVEGHYHRAVAIGYVLQHRPVPLPSLVRELEAAGKRARDIDRTFNGAGPLRLLALLYWKTSDTPWPYGPEHAGEDEVIEALFREAIELAPGCAENHVAYAEYLLKKGRRDLASEHARTAMAVLPDDPIATPFDRPDLLHRLDALAGGLGLPR